MFKNGVQELTSPITGLDMTPEDEVTANIIKKVRAVLRVPSGLQCLLLQCLVLLRVLIQPSTHVQPSAVC